MTQVVELRQVEPCPIGVVRRRAIQKELSRVVPAACGEVWQYFRATPVAKPGRHVAVYLDCTNGEINLEVGVEVDRPFTGDGNVVCSTTPAGKVATTAHLGPYGRLGEAHDAIRKWCADQGYAFAGPSWEVYGHWTDDPAQLRTDVFYLLKE
jgi:effector-binding domain-containing protein